MLADASSSTANSMGVSLIQGTFVFITGQIAPNGGIDVETPVGTIGIRGTTVGVQIATFGGFTRISNLTNPDWAALTVATVNMATTGQSLPRAILRSTGTLVGGAAALAIIGMFPDQRWGFLAALSLFIGFCVYMMKGKSYQYFWFLGALTCLVIPVISLPLESQSAFDTAGGPIPHTGHFRVHAR